MECLKKSNVRTFSLFYYCHASCFEIFIYTRRYLVNSENGLAVAVESIARFKDFKSIADMEDSGSKGNQERLHKLETTRSAGIEVQLN